MPSPLLPREYQLFFSQLPRRLLPTPPPSDAERVLSSLAPDFVSRLLVRCRSAIRAEQRGEFRILFPQDPTFPPSLFDISPAPRCIFWKGPVISELGSAVVGSRDTCSSALRAAEQTASQLALRGEVVISGLARGCDTAAHQGCLSAGGRTVAVLPCGLACVYPPENQALLRRILTQEGACCSEYLPDTPVQAWQCVQRDRIQSALSHQILIVASGENGGAMYCASWGRKQRRRVYVLPPERLGSPSPRYVSGNLLLLERGWAREWPENSFPKKPALQINKLFTEVP